MLRNFKKPEAQFCALYNSVKVLFDLRFEFLDLKIVHLGPKIIKIGQEMTILELFLEVVHKFKTFLTMKYTAT